jgi:hypothetical protein
MGIIINRVCLNVSFNLPRSDVKLTKHRVFLRISVETLDELNSAVDDLRVDYPDAELVNISIN